MALPDFLIAGAPKAGTTALHTALAAHPGLFMSAVKEPKFFLTGGPPPRGGGPGDAQTYREHIWRRADYEALFAAAPAGSLRGESTPFYLYDRGAQQRIRALIPAARLIVILRDPVERAHSNWTHLWSAGLEPIGDFPAACAAEDDRVAAGWAPFWHYTRLGRYGEQLDHLFGLFPREQVFLLRYRDLVNSPAQTLDQICEFLGVAPGLITRVPRENVTAHPRRTSQHAALARLARTSAAAGRLLPGGAGSGLTRSLERFLQRSAGRREPLTWRQRQHVLSYLADDIPRLMAVTGLDFGDWLLPRDRSGGLVGDRPAEQAQARNGQAGAAGQPGDDSSVRSSCAPSGRASS
jgi:sulfotransferase family protein